MRQPALRTNDGREPSDIAIIGAVETSGGIIKKIESKHFRLSQEEYEVDKEVAEPLQRQQSIVPIVTVSGSSPTPPSSPNLIRSETSISIVPVSGDTNIAATSATATSLLSIPGSSLDISETGRSSSTNSLVKQLSESQIPTSSNFPISIPLIKRQYSEGQVTQLTSSSRLFYPGMKPGDLFQIVPSHELSMQDEKSREGTYFVDSSSVLQIIPKGEASSSPRRPSQSREVIKDMEIIRRDVRREVEATSFDSNASVDESADVDAPSTSSTVQRSGHCPQLRDGPSLGCNYCWNSIDKCGRILRRKTKYHCPECHINLCIVPCFQEYHEKADKKKVKRNILPKPSSM